MSWGPSNPLWRWQHRKKARRSVKHKHKGVKMARRRNRYYRRARKAAGGILGGMGGKAISGVKLGVATVAVGYLANAIPQLQNPMIRGVVGLVVPSVKGIPIGQVMVAGSAIQLASPLLGGITSKGSEGGGSDPYNY